MSSFWFSLTRFSTSVVRCFSKLLSSPSASSRGSKAAARRLPLDARVKPELDDRAAETRRERLCLPSTFNALQRRARLLRPGDHLGHTGQRRQDFRHAAALPDATDYAGPPSPGGTPPAPRCRPPT